MYVFPCSTVKASTSARRRCATKTSAATRSATWRTCRRRHLPTSRSTSPTQRSGATARRPPRLAGADPRLPRHDTRGRQQGRYPPLMPQPRSRRRRRGGASGPGPRCQRTPPRGVPTSKPLMLKKTRKKCSRRKQQRLRRWEGEQRRRPARHLGRKGFPHQAPARRTTQGRTRGRRRPRPSLTSRISGRQSGKSVVLLTT
jgi:hypothetical protein